MLLLCLFICVFVTYTLNVCFVRCVVFLAFYVFFVGFVFWLFSLCVLIGVARVLRSAVFVCVLCLFGLCFFPLHIRVFLCARLYLFKCWLCVCFVCVCYLLLFVSPLACRGLFVVVFRSSNMSVCVVCLCGCYVCSS